MTASVSFTVSEDLARVVAAAFVSVRASLGDPDAPDWRCLEVLIDHFIVTHEHDELRAMRASYRVFERDGWRCTMPGCRSPGPFHAHHVVFRSHGGSDDDWNRTTLCTRCHEKVVHQGHARIAGRAPDGLGIALGSRSGSAPLSRWQGERQLGATAGREAAA